MHVQVFEWMARQSDALAPDRVLEIGSLDINGSIRPLFASASHYHGVDLVSGPGVDEVADAADWTPPGLYDVVVCAEVLEHAPKWERVMETMWSALEPGGTLLMTCAGDGRAPHSAVDGLDVRDGEYYGNVPAPRVLELVRAWGATTWSLEHASARGDLYLRVTKPPSWGADPTAVTAGRGS